MEDNRYSRQLLIPEIRNGMSNVQNVTVAIVGCGGLGSLNILYLVALGVKKLILIDGDKVDTTNLNRQIIYLEKDIGRYKVDCAEEKVKEINQYAKVKKYKKYLDKSNADVLLQDADIILDCVDNLATRYLLDDLCSKRSTPVFFSAVEGFKGFVYSRKKSNYPPYSDIFKPANHPDCRQKASFGAGVGLISCLQCLEVIKYLTFEENEGPFIMDVDMKNNFFNIIRLEEESAL